MRHQDRDDLYAAMRTHTAETHAREEIRPSIASARDLLPTGILRHAFDMSNRFSLSLEGVGLNSMQCDSTHMLRVWGLK